MLTIGPASERGVRHERLRIRYLFRWNHRKKRIRICPRLNWFLPRRLRQATRVRRQRSFEVVGSDGSQLAFYKGGWRKSQFGVSKSLFQRSLAKSDFLSSAFLKGMGSIPSQSTVELCRLNSPQFNLRNQDDWTASPGAFPNVKPFECDDAEPLQTTPGAASCRRRWSRSSSRAVPGSMLGRRRLTPRRFLNKLEKSPQTRPETLRDAE